ncbi:MAG TPA: histidinol-phosphate transaminase [Peptococcaceae bacterium]|jgi:histidinol-phosphate aminotransferase|nr:histidinol-phosphate transaminase [Peptococcaceae bacterium]HPZ70796.1 histidinol-phosphate transaminase [Peptococcaceae bacterium]HQD53829.1 histidinol-phosphate transaminase [Peptococcaceae bacterium]
MQESIKDLIPYDPGLTIEQLEKQIGKTMVKLSANESLWGPSPHVYELLRQKTALNYYPDGAAVRLKQLLAEDWKLAPDYFCMGNGADEIIFLLANSFLNPGDEAVIPTPTFSSYETAVRIVGGKATLVPQPELTFNLEEIASLTGRNTKMVFLCNPNNPTGTIFSAQALKAFLAQVSPQTLVILDEAYCHYVQDAQYPSSRELVRQYENLIILRTFSKVFGLAALRIGYAVASPKLIRELEKVRAPYNVNSLAQAAAIAAWQDKPYLQKVVDETCTERTRLIQRLQECGLKLLPSQANFVLIRHAQAILVAELLLQEGFLVRNTASFGLPDWFRVTIGPAEKMDSFMEAVRKVLQVI